MTGEEKRKRIDDYADQSGYKLLVIPDMDDAIVGIGWKFTDPSVVYSTEKILEILMKDDMTYETAREYFDFNIAGGYVGEHTPIFLTGVDDLVL
jgi:hypothetical protein